MLKNKVVLITGVSKGIGLSCLKLCLENNAYVIGVSRGKFKQESFAEYEELTQSYSLINVQLALRLSNSFKAILSAHNLLNEEYSPHISRVRGVAGGVPSPGRFYNMNLKYEF